MCTGGSGAGVASPMCTGGSVPMCTGGSGAGVASPMCTGGSVPMCTGGSVPMCTGGSGAGDAILYIASLSQRFEHVELILFVRVWSHSAYNF